MLNCRFHRSTPASPFGDVDSSPYKLVETLIAAPDRESLIAATRALDRVLLWNWYVIPHWHDTVYRVAYWNRFSHPAVAPKYGLGFQDTWWVDPEKNAKLANSPRRTEP